MKEPLESMDALQGSRDKTYNLMYIFNQLMTHQCLLNMSYMQNVIFIKKVRQIGLEGVLNVYKLYIDHLKEHIKTDDVYDFSDMKLGPKSQKPLKDKEDSTVMTKI